jgi:hypothetical protein
MRARYSNKVARVVKTRLTLSYGIIRRPDRQGSAKFRLEGAFFIRWRAFFGGRIRPHRGAQPAQNGTTAAATLVQGR